MQRLVFLLSVFLAHHFLVKAQHIADIKRWNDSAQYFYAKMNYDEAKKYVDKVVEAKAAANTRELAIAYTIKGNISGSGEGDFRSARLYFRKALSLTDSIELKGYVLSALGSSYGGQSMYDSAQIMYDQSFKVDTSEENAMRYFRRTGILFKRQQEYTKAIEAYLKSLNISLYRQKDTVASTSTLANIANIYVEQNDPDKALEFYHKAMDLLDTSVEKFTYQRAGIYVFTSSAYLAKQDYKSTEEYLKRALYLGRRESFPQFFESEIIWRLGQLEQQRNNLPQALNYLHQATIMQRQLQLEHGLISTLVSLAEVNIKLRKPDQAILSLEEALPLAMKEKSKIDLSKIYRLLSHAHEELNNASKALAFYKLSSSYKDTLFNASKAEAIEALTRKFETQQKERTIAEQQHIIERQKQNLIIFVLIASLVLLTIVIFYFKSRFRNKLRLHEETKEQEQKRLKAIVSAEEQIQQRISMELHDNIGQKVIALKMNLEKERNVTVSSLQLLNDITNDIRKASHTLSSHLVENESLEIGIKAVLEYTFKDHAISFSFDSFNIRSQFKKDIQISLYRIFQELITNVIKHAEASAVSVQLYEHEDHLILTVEDNGTGVKNSSPGMGLNNIENRCKMMGGIFTLQATEGQGTVASIRIPLKSQVIPVEITV